MRSPSFLQVTFIILALGCSSESSSNHSPSAGGSSSAGTTGSGGNEDGSSGSSQGGSTSHLPSFGKSGNAGTDDGGLQGEGGVTNDGDGGIDDDGGAGGDVNAGGNGGNGSGGADPGEDTTAPSIAAISPEDGANGVQSDAQIVIEFSEPMNTASVEGAFDSGNLPGVDFSWNTANTILTLTPQSELSYAEGFDTSVVAEGYDFGIATGAQDLAGNALPAADFDFTTLRRIATVLSGVSNLDGFAQADG
ncbi:MAG TPA: Ig-like domain-containing protein, partial [Polyangiaceae bacterium]|nr:Ig-like domain-containing protein [Polyangiaceae bacterium]